MRTGSKLLGVAALIAAGLLVLPAPAQAWWARGGFYGPRVYVGPPVFVAPAPVPVYLRPPVVLPWPGAFWVRPHYTRYGAFVPGHWQ